MGKGFAQAQVHTEFIALVTKALSTICTSVSAKPFPRIIVPMAKLHFLIVLIYNAVLPLVGEQGGL